MLQYMLDTDTCIQVIKKYPDYLSGKFNRLGHRICISSITLAELHYGAERSARRIENLEEIAIFTGHLQMLAFGDKAAAHYGEIRAHLAKTGTPVGLHDMLIAAHARSEGLIAVTRNRKEFDRIPGLRVESWL